MKPKAITTSQRDERDRFGVIFNELQKISELPIEELRQEINNLSAVLDFAIYLQTSRVPTWTDRLKYWWRGLETPERLNDA